MTDETSVPQATEPETAAEVTTAPPASPPPVAEAAPLGFVRTAFLSFVNGVLHQEWHNPFVGGEHPAKVLVPVAGTSVPAGLLSSIEEMIKSHVVALEARVVELEQRLAAQTSAPSA